MRLALSVALGVLIAAAAYVALSARAPSERWVWAPELDADVGFDPKSGLAAVTWATGAPGLELVNLRRPSERRSVPTPAQWPRHATLAPGGGWVAFHERRSDEQREWNRLYLMRADGSDAQPVFPFEPDTQTRLALFSPTADALLFDLQRDKARSFALVHLSPRTLTPLTQLPPDAKAVTWSRTGDALLFFSKGCLSRAPLGGGEVERLLCLPHGEHVLDVAGGALSPDGQRLAFPADTGDCEEVEVAELAARTVRRALASHRCGVRPVWLGDQRLAFIAPGADGSRVPVLVNVESGAEQALGLDPGVTYGLTADDGGLFAVAATPESPRSIFRLEPGQPPRQVLAPAPEHSLAARVESVDVKGPDGATVPTLVFRPAVDAAQQPVVLWVHGGTHGREDVSPRWLDELEYLVHAGYVVIAPNYRGSTGHGDALKALGAPDGGDDLDGKVSDLLAAAAFVHTQPGLDATRVSLFGVCYGATLATMMLARAPDAFRGAVAWDLDEGALAEQAALPRVSRPVLVVAPQALLRGRDAAALHVDAVVEVPDGHNILRAENRERGMRAARDFLQRISR